ncbi:MAG: Holliday junction branch migration protein RuvA [Gammaproteobacteria bacterium]|nr:Holliday junction branch migration protein RuvA [Gammaproteobacteria bacterium]
MIARLSGELILKSPPYLLIEVGGVTYELLAPMSTFYKLPEVGMPVVVLTHMIVREDAHTLYAFTDPYDKALFKELLKVSGVGAKMALAILSSMEEDVFRQSIENEDAGALATLPGIGAKTAQRLIVEMKDRFKDEFWQASETTTTSRASDQSQAASGALVSLGYKPSEAKKMVEKVDTEGKTLEEIIRAALRLKI